MPSALRELHGLRVSIDQVLYMPQLDAPEDQPFPFAYFITITNGSDEIVTLKGRKWVVTDAENCCIVVEGDGIVGQNPRLEPGESFTYNSYHVIRSDSVAEGAYIGLTADGEPIITRIPRFEMKVPV